jgi:hypothetical protein
MFRVVPIVLLLGLVASHQPNAQEVQTVGLGSFVGVWAGTQAWAVEPRPASAEEPQPVTLTIEMRDGQLFGTLLPFMGGTDGASFVGGRIVGERLQVTGVIGKPRASTDGTAAAGRGRGGWKESVTILFELKADKTELTGTADVVLNDVKWTKFTYNLSRKRSRY